MKLKPDMTFKLHMFERYSLNSLILPQNVYFQFSSKLPVVPNFTPEDNQI